MNDSWEEVARESGTHCARTQLVEALHREAFRGSGLANSLLAPEYNIRHMVRVLKIFVDVTSFFLHVFMFFFGHITHWKFPPC